MPKPDHYTLKVIGDFSKCEWSPFYVHAPTKMHLSKGIGILLFSS